MKERKKNVHENFFFCGSDFWLFNILIREKFCWLTKILICKIVLKVLINFLKIQYLK
jgi:hypothetical protein